MEVDGQPSKRVEELPYLENPTRAVCVKCKQLEGHKCGLGKRSEFKLAHVLQFDEIM